MSARRTTEETAAVVAAESAREWIEAAIACYGKAGFGSHVTQPLRDALANVEYSLREVTQ